MLNLLPLSQLLALRNEAYPLAWLAGRQLTLQHLRRDVAALSHWLQAQPGRRWALCYQESYHFAVALLACGHAGCHAVLPGHNRAAQLAELAPHFDGVLTDIPQLVNDLGPSAWLVAGATVQQPWDARVDVPFPALPLPAWQGLTLTLFTSGSTGEPKAIHKTQQQLEAEVRVQADLWQAILSSASQSVLLASVSHQHIYGLLFRILLPLCVGIPFVAETVEYPEQLRRWLAHHPDRPWIFISSPAFLARLDPELPVAGCRQIFCSGGPLAADAAQLSQQLYGQWPVEIYGSSETGGIAWRQAETVGRQAETDYELVPNPEALWRPLPGVETSQDEEGCLLIRSPFLDSPAWWSTSDRVSLSGSGFALLGRQDRLIKLAEKRVSLDEVEQRLRMSPWVAEAAAVPLRVATRDLLAAALVLTPEGEAQWQALGAGRFLLALRQSLRPWLEPVALPRRVRP
ncbi:MAG: AMP-binding protein, partial [Aeromonadaceae bacterium]